MKQLQEQVTFNVDEDVATYIKEDAEKHSLSLDDWLQATAEAIEAANDITYQRLGEIPPGDPPPSPHVPPPPPGPDHDLEETPPAFWSPYGPVPALERPQAAEELLTEEITEKMTTEQTTIPPGEPPIVELLPDSNPGGFWQHTVAAGDTLSNIASRFYGHNNYLPIAQANNINPPYIIYVGQTLAIPKQAVVANNSVSTLSTNCPPWQQHTVQAGDTLSTIAGHYYGASNQFWRIANCNNIPAPNYVIYVGDRLSIPAWVT